jgi:hypothetical protein
VPPGRSAPSLALGAARADNIGVKGWVFGFSAVAVVALLAAGAIFAVHRGHVQQRQQQLDRLQSVSSNVATLEESLEATGGDFSTTLSNGAKASQKRHDAAMANDGDAEILPMAKTEYADVDRAKSLNETIESQSSAIAQAYSGIYGDATAKALAESSSAHDACENELDDWSRAIGDIRDSIQASIDGRYAPANNSEEYYRDSDREQVQCERHSEAFTSEAKRLDSRLSSDIRAAQASLARF